MTMRRFHSMTPVRIALAVTAALLWLHSSASAQVLIWSIPEDGAFIKFQGTYKTTQVRPKDKRGDQTLQWNTELTIKSVGEEMAEYKGEKQACRWIEFVSVIKPQGMKPGPSGTRVYKVLVPVAHVTGEMIDKDGQPNDSIPIVRGYRRLGNPETKLGTLSARTDDAAGELKLSPAHGFAMGNALDLFWTDAAGMVESRRGVVAATVAGDTVTIKDGAGAKLPPQGTSITVNAPVLEQALALNPLIVPVTYYPNLKGDSEEPTPLTLPQIGDVQALAMKGVVVRVSDVIRSTNSAEIWRCKDLPFGLAKFTVKIEQDQKDNAAAEDQFQKTATIEVEMTAVEKGVGAISELIEK